MVRKAVGFFGHAAGPDVHVIDVMGLADPLLARLPVADVGRWRIGHYQRELPEGYVETIRSGTNQLADPALAEYYDQLTLIVREPLFAPGRLAAIWRINTGSLTP